jgi:hypothetical protein
MMWRAVDTMLVAFPQLQEYAGRKRPQDVVRWLNDRRIAWTTDGKGRPVTTLTQIDKALETGRPGVGEEFDFGGP